LRMASAVLRPSLYFFVSYCRAQLSVRALEGRVRAVLPHFLDEPLEERPLLGGAMKWKRQVSNRSAVLHSADRRRTAPSWAACWLRRVGGGGAEVRTAGAKISGSWPRCRRALQSRALIWPRSPLNLALQRQSGAEAHPRLLSLFVYLPDGSVRLPSRLAAGRWEERRRGRHATAVARGS
jgi:hypothetical protein